MSQVQQLLPGFSFRLDSTFASFYCNQDLAFVVENLKKQAVSEPAQHLFLFGASGSGKSHLLQAVCNAANSAIYLPLNELVAFPAEQVLEGVLDYATICIDDVEQVQHSAQWQEALFNLYNQCSSEKKSLCFSASKPASQLGLSLADLQSRLSACLAFYLPPLNDEEKAALLQSLGKQRGFDINEPCAHFIIQRSDRSNQAIMQVLKQLDEASLQAKRKITIPFIKELLHW